MKGLRTVLLNGVIIGVLAFLTWATNVDWTQYVSPTTAMILTAAANFGLRFLTTTPVGKAT